MLPLNQATAFRPCGFREERVVKKLELTLACGDYEIVRPLKEGIVSPDGIDEKIKVHINGIDQWLSIRGKDRRNPILLFLHGGHTDSVRPPSTRMIWPVTNGASRSSHSTAPATSSGAPARCNGVRASIAC